MALEGKPDWAVLASADSRDDLSIAKVGVRQYPEAVSVIAESIKGDVSQLLQYTQHSLPKLLHKSDGNTSVHPIVGPKTAILEMNLVKIGGLLEEITSVTNLDVKAQRGVVKTLWKEIEKTPRLLANAAGYDFRDIAKMKQQGGEGSMFCDKISKLGEAYYGFEREMGFEAKHDLTIRQEAGELLMGVFFMSGISFASAFGVSVGFSLSALIAGPIAGLGAAFGIRSSYKHYRDQVLASDDNPNLSPIIPKMVADNFQKLDDALKVSEDKAALEQGENDVRLL